MLTESEPRRLAPELLAAIDSAAARIHLPDGDLAEWFSTYHRQHRARLAGDLRIVGELLEAGDEVLDCGALPLLTTAALDRLGYRVRGVDLAPGRFGPAIEELGLDVAACDVERQPLPFADATFRAVLFHELFEHLRIDPIFTLGELRRVLEPGGLLLLSTPNLRSFRGLRNLIARGRASTGGTGVYDEYRKLRSLGHMGHVREYTVAEVTDFLTRTGFGIERAIFRGVVGLAERCFPGLRPAFTIVASRPAA